MLQPGTKLGPYEILAQLGAGGMGEVYKARDVRLDRLVALKVLAPHLAGSLGARERFEREATTVAKLKHAHICVLYDIGQQEVEVEDPSRERERPVVSGSPERSWPEAEEAEVQVPRRFTPRDDRDDGDDRDASDDRRVRVDYLVLEYLEGETLAQRLKRGPLPLEQVFQYAVEIADALDKAHRAGVTHRDIKPGNIMLVPSSETASKTETKLLDFGLAKLKQEVEKATIPASERPTIPGGGLTQGGTILGTLHYMAPEQLESKEVDGRADIFSFGACVHEMLTGKKAFPGETPASVIAKILDHTPPPISSLEPPGKLSPPALDRLVATCVAKDREDRWQTMRDVCRELKWIKGSSGSHGPAAAGPWAGSGSEKTHGIPQAGPWLPAPPARTKLRDRAAWIAAGVAVLAFLAALVPATLYFRRPAEEAVMGRFLVDTPQGANPNQLAISPDGRRLAFVGLLNGVNHIWVRPLDSLTAQPVPGSENANFPVWSPDGRSLGFTTGGRLKKIEVAGGPALTLADATTGFGITWNQDGVIVFTTGNGLLRVAAAGGEPIRVTTRDTSRGEINHYSPHFLPDGRHFLYTVLATRPESQGIFVGTLDSQEKTRLLSDFSMAQYAPPAPSAREGAPGYLLFVRQGTLMAQPFDAARLQLAGEAFPVAEQVAINPGNGRAGFAVSASGILAYRTGLASEITQLGWFDRNGGQLGTIGQPGVYLNPRLSPDGKRIAVEQVTANNRDIWILEVERGIASRFTFDPAEEYDPIWSPDGKQIAYVSKSSLYQKPSSGAGTEEILLQDGVGTTAHDWSSDGRFITYRPTQGTYIWVLPLAGGPLSREAGSGTAGQGPKPFSFLQNELATIQSQISPDGKWLAYLSLESGRYELYVQSFPTPGAKWQISTGGAVQPRWRRDGKELFYIALDGKLMAVPIRGNGTLEVGAPQALFETRTVLGTATGVYFLQQYDVAPDGQRFLMNVAREGPATAPITVVLNWTAGIRK